MNTNSPSPIDDPNTAPPKHIIGLSATEISLILLGIVIVIFIIAGIVWFFRHDNNEQIKVIYRPLRNVNE